jgi:hypothetical protein
VVSLALLFGTTRALKGRVSGLLAGMGNFGSKFTLQQTGVALPQLPRGGAFFSPGTAQDLAKIGAALDRYTREGDYVLFFPLEPAYYFLFNRRTPTRYVNAYFAATAAQRREMVNELELHRPACVVYSLDDWRIDGIPEYQQVPEVVRYLGEKYSLAEDLGNILILRRKGA